MDPENGNQESDSREYWADQYFENAGTVMVQLDMDGSIERINERGREFLGYDAGELEGEDWFETVVPADSSVGVDAVFDALLNKGTEGIEVHENYIETKSGERRLIKWHNSVLRDEDGELVGILGSGSDITESRRTERRLRNITEEYESVIENADDAIFLIDVEHTDSGHEFEYRYLNPAHEKQSGLSNEQVQGKTPREIHGEDLGAEIRSNYGKCVEARETITYYEELEMPEGNLVWQTRLAPVVLDGEVTRIVGVARDLTDRLDRENELHRQNKRLDEFASVLSHDLRNPLNVAQGRAELIQEDCQTGHIDPLVSALERMETMIEDTLTLARHGERVQEPEPLDVSDLVEKCWSMVDTGDATVTMQDPLVISGDESRLRHLFENLFRNAIQHAGEGVSIRIGAIEGGFYVEDDGPGIPEDERSAVFEPGHRSAEGGTGFGLTIVRRIAEAHGWEVSVGESESGGARFEFVGVDLES